MALPAATRIDIDQCPRASAACASALSAPRRRSTPPGTSWSASRASSRRSPGSRAGIIPSHSGQKIASRLAHWIASCAEAMEAGGDPFSKSADGRRPRAWDCPAT